MRKLKHWFAFSFSLMLILPVYGQIKGVRHFGLDRKLFPSRIECLAQSHQGHLLVGTLAGLVVYDGYDFKTIGVRDGLAESSVSTIMVREKEVWLGHWTGNLTLYLPELDSFRRFDLSRQLEFSSIKKIVKGESQQVFILTNSGRLFTLDSNGIERLALPVAEFDKVIDLWVDEGKIFAVLNQGILTLQLKKDAKWTWSWKHNENDIRFLTAISDGKLLMQTRDSWWYLLRTAPDEWRLEELNGMPQIEVMSCAKDLYGAVWLATKGKGVIRFDPTTRLSTSLQRSNGLNYDETRAVFVDREGNVWIATAAGLDQYLGDAFTRYDKGHGIPGNMIWDVEMVNGKLLVATDQGLSIHQMVNEADLTWPTATFFEGNQIIQMTHDQSNRTFALDANGAVWEVDLELGKTSQLDNIGSIARCIAVVNGDLWAGTDDGILILDPISRRIVEKLTTQTGLAGSRITGIYYSKQQNETWITALGSELTRFKDGKFKKYRLQDDEQVHVIMDADFDQSGNIWLATYDDGIYFYNNEAFSHLNAEREEVTASSYALAIDQRGAVWIGRNGGIDMYLPAIDEYQMFSEEDGFMGVEVNPGAMSYHPVFGLWLGTLMGVVNFNPKGMNPNPFEPTLNITSARLGKYDLLRSTSIHALFGSDNDLEVNFQSVSLTNPSKNRYFYRLKGVHENWRMLEKPLTINYYALPIGDFEFELKACNNSGVCTTSYEQFSFSVSPPFYRTWWFYTLLFVVIVLAIFFMDRYRSVALLDDKNRLSEIIEQKEQAYIELDQRAQELLTERRIEMRVLKGLRTFRNPDMERIREVLPDFSDYYQSAEQGVDVLSKGILFFRNEYFASVLAVDTGFRGAASQNIIAELQLSINDAWLAKNDPETVLLTWLGILQKLEQKLIGFRGITWLMAIEANGQVQIASSGIKLYGIKGGLVHALEINASLHNIDELLTGILDFVAIPERMLEQLNESGTKSYPEKKLIEVLEKSIGQNSQHVAQSVFTSFNRWRGIMEQFDDLAVYIWRKRD